jgi:glycosyltransferase involved in cell wall biosynthesis
MSKPKVLYISHNHPTIRPGGAEAYALELYEAFRESEAFEPLLVARAGPPMPEPGTPFIAIDGDDHQYLYYTTGADYDWFYGTSRNKEIYTSHFHEFLLVHKPAVIHFQHTMLLGYDLIRQVRNTLPDAAIVFTLHEYLPICYLQGQMVRAVDDELCLDPAPRRCNECFPDIPRQDFFLRKRFIQSSFASVDLFIAPSRFLLERYVDWGIPRHKIHFDDYGRRGVPTIPVSDEERPRHRLGFFGQFNRYKGINVLLRAMSMVPEGGCQPHLWVHGANLDIQTRTFQEEFRSLIEAQAHNVTLIGRYDHAQLPELMSNVDWVVVPSIWWENSPLVIQEAFLYGRPVICSDIGGMAEKVGSGVNGLHFRAGDPSSLAAVIQHAVNTPGLWEKLRAGIPPIYPMHEHREKLTRTYQELVAQKQGAVYAS